MLSQLILLDKEKKIKKMMGGNGEEKKLKSSFRVLQFLTFPGKSQNFLSTRIIFFFILAINANDLPPLIFTMNANWTFHIE